MYELQVTVKLSRYPEGYFHIAIDLARTMLMKLKIFTSNLDIYLARQYS